MDAKLAVYGDGAHKVTGYLKSRFGFLVLSSLSYVEELAYGYLGFEPVFPVSILGNYYPDIQNLIPYSHCSKHDFIYAYKLLQSALGNADTIVSLLADFIAKNTSYSSIALEGPLCAAEKEYLRCNGFELVSAGKEALSAKHLFTESTNSYLHAQILGLDIFKPDLKWT